MTDGHLREIRRGLELSQRVFAARLGVPAESYRIWEAGRRPVPQRVKAKAETLACDEPATLPMSLGRLATVLGVSEMTLRIAARRGRLSIVRDAPRYLGKPILRAFRKDGEEFLSKYYRRSRWNIATPPRLPEMPCVPPDCAERVRLLRLTLRLSQRNFAHLLGAAGKAVVYQWESGKRRPSPMLWLRLIDLGA